jgi:hypothetical protein
VSLSANLLALLPQDLLVVDCADCGRLATNEWLAFKKWAPIGLRLVSRWRLHRSGHRSPVCDFCNGTGHRRVPGPGEHRGEGQGVPIWREMRSL